MSYQDVFATIATAAAILTLGYAALSYHRPKAPIMPEPSVKSQKWRSPVIPLVLAIVAWAAVVFDYYDRHASVPNEPEVVQGWGINAPSIFWIMIDTKPFLDRKDKYKIALIIRVNYSDIDRMTDTAISKSEMYTITGERISISIPHPKLRAIPLVQNVVEFDLVLIPIQYSINQISSLSDIEKLGGTIIAHPSTNFIPVDQNPPTSPPT